MIVFLKSLGFSPHAIKLIQNYVSERIQRVITDNIILAARVLFDGAPQGSILGPLIYILYTSRNTICI